MKKIWTLLCMIAILFCTNLQVFAGTDNSSLNVDCVIAEAGESIDVPIRISNNTGICGATISISYDEKLVLTGIESGNAFSSMTLTKPGKLSANPVKLVWDSMDADYTNGIIAVLTFTAPKETGLYNISVSYEDGDVVDGDLNPVELNIVNGIVEVSDVFSDISSYKPIINLVNANAYNKLTISWDQSTEADGYVLYRSTSKSGEYSILKTITDSLTTSYINSVTSGVTYYYRLQAYKLNNSGEKVFSQYSEVLSGRALPDAPKLQSTVMAAYNKIRITWTKINGCEGYVIYRSTDENGTYNVLKTVTQATATEYVNVVTSSQDYYYKIRAFVTVDGKKVYGNFSNVCMGNVISGSPKNFKIKVLSSTKINLAWDKVEDADGYVIYMCSIVDGAYKAIKNIKDINVLSYNKNISIGDKYYFIMRAYRNINGKLVYSEYTDAITN